MIGKIVTGEDGNPVDGQGQKLSASAYQPSPEITKLFARVQTDYQTAWRLQHRPFDEFDGYSLLQRARMDQQTFGTYVGAVEDPVNKSWRWKGRKNTARNKIIGILAQVIAGMLFPYCYAYNEEDEEDKMTARVMKILIENHLREADYETKFLFMMTSALVNPAVIVEVEYVEAIQRIKKRLADGTIEVVEAIDELLSGVNLNIVPIDQFLIADFFTGDVQRQPYVVRVRRISWDEARKIYQGKYKQKVNGEEKDPFDFVMAGKTRVVMAGQEHQTLYDIEWTEADANFVQEITMYYRPEDLEVTFLGGVFMGNDEDIYNSNPFKHRRMSLIGNEWVSIPVYNFAKSGFEPLDPTGRFFYYKSCAFKEFWDDAAQNKMHQMAFDGTMMDVFKPLFLSGVAKADSFVIAPGMTAAMPANATVTPYQLGPNIIQAMNMMNQQKTDMSESTVDKVMTGAASTGVTAYATAKAEENARRFLGVFGIMIADLIKQVGELTMDCIIQHTTKGEIDATIPESLKMKYRSIISKGKDGGKEITNKIDFSTEGITDLEKGLSPAQARELEWNLFEKAGGIKTDQRVYKVNPYKFARHKYSIYIDPTEIISRSMGTDRMRKDRAFQILTHPSIAPFTDPEAVANDQIEEVTVGDPDKFKKKKGGPNDLLNTIMGQAGGKLSPDMGGGEVVPTAEMPAELNVK